MCLFPAIPRFAAAGLWEPCCSPPAVLGSGHLMETFIPSAPLHHWAASPKMHPALHTLLQLCLQSFSFCIPARGCPRVGTRGLMPNPKHTGRAAQEGSTCPGRAAAGAPAPRGWGLQQCLAHQTSRAANYILQRSQNYRDGFTCKLGSGGCSVAVLWEAEFGVIFREDYKYRGEES